MSAANLQIFPILHSIFANHCQSFTQVLLKVNHKQFHSESDWGVNVISPACYNIRVLFKCYRWPSACLFDWQWNPHYNKAGSGVLMLWMAKQKAVLRLEELFWIHASFILMKGSAGAKTRGCSYSNNGDQRQNPPLPLSIWRGRKLVCGCVCTRKINIDR